MVASERSRLAVRGFVQVSIPFIAGQWSLLDGFIKACGIFLVSFNPLHCGAVVASALGELVSWVDGFVSIPFIAGQWSLHEASPGKD